MIGQREVVVSAIERFQRGKADFGDYLILAEGDISNVPRLATFDKALCKDSEKCLSPQELL